LQLRCCTRHGFMPKSHELRIVGVCAECISNASTSPA
jgi:Fe2+ or Zn2+ uptake regulation protein